MQDLLYLMSFNTCWSISASVHVQFVGNACAYCYNCVSKRVVLVKVTTSKKCNGPVRRELEIWCRTIEKMHNGRNI
jgi:hypothetical protein